MLLYNSTIFTDLQLRRAVLIRIYSLGPLCHFIAVPARTVGIRLLHLRVELPTVGEVVHRLEGEGGLVPGEVQWKVHYEGQTGREGQRRLCRCVLLHFFFLFIFLPCLPCTRKQKSFHMRRRVSLVKPSASYSTTPLEQTRACQWQRFIEPMNSLVNSHFPFTGQTVCEQGNISDTLISNGNNRGVTSVLWGRLTFQSG